MPMVVWKRGDVYYCSVYENGRRKKYSTHCRDKQAAEAVARDLERRAADPLYAAAHGATIRDAIRLLIANRDEKASAGRGSKATVEFYTKKAGHLLRVFEENGATQFYLRNLGARHVDQYISARRAEGASEGTIHKELVTLRAALKIAQRAGLWVGSIPATLPIAFAPAYKPKTRFLSRDELIKLCSEMYADHAARVAFIVATSASWHETELAERYDVTPGFDTVLIRGTKRSSRYRRVPIVTPWQKDLIQFAVKHARGTKQMFESVDSIRQHLRWACKRAGIAECSPNDLRRTCATWLRADGVPPDLIAPIMGHADTRMVERVYGRLDVETLRERVRAAAGLPGPDPMGHRWDKDQTPEAPADASDAGKSLILLPRDGIEPPTRGFSIPGIRMLPPRYHKVNCPGRRTGGTPVGQLAVVRMAVGEIPMVSPSTRARR